MARKEHPRYGEWLEASNHLDAAKQRLQDAKARNDKALAAYQHDYDKAQAALDKIVQAIDDEDA